MSQVITLAQQKGGSGKTTLAANLAVSCLALGKSVAVLDTDPQGSLGRWFMTRRAGGRDDLSFSTSSAWGVSYEVDKLKDAHDVVIIDTPPKIDADLRPALRAASLIVVPVAASLVDVWATESVIDLARREHTPAMLVLNRARQGTKLAEETRQALQGFDAALAETVLGNRVAYAEALGTGRGVAECGRGAWRAEMAALTREVLAAAG